MTFKYKTLMTIFNAWTFALLAISTVAMPSFSATTQNIQSLEKKIKDNPNHIPTRETLGRVYSESKRYDKTIELLAPYSNEISNDSLILLAAAYGESGDNLNEIRMLQALEVKEPNRFRPKYLLGMAFKKLKKFDEAAQNFRASIDLAPQHRPSYEALLEIFSENKQNYESRILLNDMLRVFGKKADIMTRSCKLYAVDGFIKEAISTCNEAIRINPKTPENHIFLAQAYFDQSNTAAAERVFKTAARQFPKSEFVQYAAGEFYLTEKNFSAAVRYLEEAVKINPKSNRAQLTLAQSLFESRNYDKALLHFNEACHLDKSSESLNAFRSAAAKLRQMNQSSKADAFDKKIALCR